MTLEQLRIKHPRLIYKRFFIEQSDQAIIITHEFLLEPDVVFRPKVTIPRLPAADRRDGGQAYSGKIDEEILRPYAFNLGMVEAISYWKAACPGEFVVEAGALTSEQVRFWYDLFLHGLGEFFYRNQIDFTQQNFLRIRVSEEAEVGMPLSRPKLSLEDKAELFPRGLSFKSIASDLILIGGGKDSAVTLGILKGSDRMLQTIVLNSTKAAMDTIRAAGLSDPIVVTRTIDPKLFELNAAGYLNGHTPFSAYLAFLGITVAALYGNENVIVSNEKSANEGNVVYHGMEVNHQYSKSFRFETMFRDYVSDNLPESANYFSMLRPLNDLQIGKLLTQFPQFFLTFRSCNVGSKTNTWCGACAKCAFTYLSLSPFLSYEQLFEIFGGELFARSEIIEHIRAMVGLTPVKPFECVGTRDEAKLAVILSVEQYKKDNREVPEGLLKIKSDMQATESDISGLKESVMDNWGDTYNLPPEHLAILRSAYYGRNSG